MVEVLPERFRLELPAPLRPVPLDRPLCDAAIRCCLSEPPVSIGREGLAATDDARLVLVDVDGKELLLRVAPAGVAA